jgi:hypothetical protein
METLLFNDAEVFVKERPENLTEKQEAEIWQKLAKEVIDNGWLSNGSIEDVIKDLEDLSKYDSGFEKAKDLDNYRAKANYNIETSFIQWLDDFDSEFNDAKRENVRRWVKAHNIKPKLEKGTKLIINEQFSRDEKMKIGNIIYINGAYEPEAQYYVSQILGANSNLCISYEKIERCCAAS